MFCKHRNKKLHSRDSKTGKERCTFEYVAKNNGFGDQEP